ncbi:MAG: NAD(P)-dependent oxidoreductase [Anaerolineales bacterium]|nr:NAD(P)-dependent oxidoreductase [Anaerolineales bacterium]
MLNKRVNGEPFFITGALGCIGAWTVRNLVRQGARVTVFDLGRDVHRLRLIMTPAELEQVAFVHGDITDLDSVETALRTSGAMRVIHLAALQVPFCRADPSLGARVNVVGTVNVLEAARRIGASRVVYASSVAVFGSSEEDPDASVADHAPLVPGNLYGVYKQANEGTARIYWQDWGVCSIGLRPHTLYGPGRDQGLTSSPTKAMLAAAAGLPYHIPYGGRGGMQYADDIANIFIRSALVDFSGAAVFNVRGSVVDMAEIVAAIEHAVPEQRGTITYDPKPLPLPADLDDSRLRVLIGDLPNTSLADGVQSTIELFRAALADGRLTTERL